MTANGPFHAPVNSSSHCPEYFVRSWVAIYNYIPMTAALLSFGLCMFISDGPLTGSLFNGWVMLVQTHENISLFDGKLQ